MTHDLDPETPNQSQKPHDRLQKFKFSGERIQTWITNSSVECYGSRIPTSNVTDHESQCRMLWITNSDPVCCGSRIPIPYVLDHEFRPRMLWITNSDPVCCGSRIPTPYVVDHDFGPRMLRITNSNLVCSGSRIPPNVGYGSRFLPWCAIDPLRKPTPKWGSKLQCNLTNGNPLHLHIVQYSQFARVENE